MVIWLSGDEASDMSVVEESTRSQLGKAQRCIIVYVDLDIASEGRRKVGLYRRDSQAFASASSCATRSRA